jgi:threonylcarbamoyladenosine tRNA methylthiotransferase MtaB
MSAGQKTAAFYTLGCKLNYAETSSIADQMEKEGYQRVGFKDEADVYVVNTCSVTNNANRECRRIIRKARRQSPHAHVVVVGCYAQLKPQEIAEIDGVDVVLGATEKFEVPKYVRQLEKETSNETGVYSCDIQEANFFTDAFSYGNRTRAFLKVQDGCDYHCAFCTIPLARGDSRSDSINNVVQNARHLAQKDVKEIVLTGVNIGDFGKNTDETFLDLIQALDQVEGIERFRISSIEPNLLTDEIIEFVARSQRFVPHFHVPLQSGCDKILKRMRRRYLSDHYRGRVAQIKKRMPHCSIGVDVIVGFPTETEEDFLETYEFIKALDVSYLHVFTYSERENTPALQYEEVVPKPERKRRNKMLRILSAKKQRAFYEQHLGETRPVLFEDADNSGSMYGYTDNYIKVKRPYTAELANTIQPVQLNEILEDRKGLVCSQQFKSTQKKQRLVNAS